MFNNNEEATTTFELIDFIVNRKRKIGDDQNNREDEDCLMKFLKDRFQYEREKRVMFANGNDLIGRNMCLTLEYHTPNDWIPESCLPLTHSVKFKVNSRVDPNNHYAELREPGSTKTRKFNFYMQDNVVKDREGNTLYISDEESWNYPYRVLLRRNDSEFSKCGIVTYGCMFRYLQLDDMNEEDKAVLKSLKIRDDMSECLLLKASDSSETFSIDLLLENGKLFFEIDSEMYGETLQHICYSLDDAYCMLYVKGEKLLNELVWQGDIISKDEEDECLTVGKFTLCEDIITSNKPIL